ncbi:efflux RND transporter periplasmic adaptor subunit [Tropicimonas sp. IMCC34043]|uniref:efflux RND transporter periplasmic adaptor subunit n=1 Tax=Tropicimonas sp. IMCC34043 TaxID=2248760 RepID=UPI000E249690|nr:HlyD family efflux transporter periplasmic adaptor subunit [Tropicimonas sp. IMCC34043]
MQFLRRSLVGLFLLSLTLGLLAYAGGAFYAAVQERLSREARQTPAEERVLAVNTVAIELQDATPVMTAFGEIGSRRTLEVRASAAGRIVELAEGFESGAAVQAGDVLLRIDPEDAEAAVEVARADLAEAEVELRDADRTLALVRDELVAIQVQADLRQQALDRQNNLSDRGFGSDAAIETAALAAAAANQAVVSQRMAVASAENRLDVAGNGLARARIALAKAERDLVDTVVKAPFSGTLADVAVVEGGLLSQNEQIATIIDPTDLEVAFRLSTAQYARLLDKDGTLIEAPVKVTLDVQGLDLEATGVINRASASVGEGQTGRQLFARLDGFAGFRPGDFVTVHIREPQMRDVAVLPATALDASQGVLVVNAENRLEAGQVTLLRRQGNDVIVDPGPLVGARIVSELSPLLGPGIRVREFDPAAAKPDLVANGIGGGSETAETIALTPERRAALIAAVEANLRMPAEAKARVLAQLQEDLVPARTVARIEARMGG